MTRFPSLSPALSIVALPIVALPIVALLAAAVPGMAEAATDGPPAVAGEVVAGPPLAAELRTAGWRLYVPPGKAAARFSRTSDGAIRIAADDAVAFLYRRLEAPAVGGRRLAWRWRVDRTGPPSDLSRAGGDDRPVALHLVFPVDTGALTMAERIALAWQRTSGPFAGRVLTYVWGGTRRRGETFANPYAGPWGRIIVLRPGDEPLGGWRRENVDYVADYEKAFGSRPPPPAVIALSADSDDNDGRSRAAVAGLRFGKEEAANRAPR